MGLGGSAALAVSVIRALNGYFQLSLSDEDINGIAFEAEKLAHGTPSGIDNTLATFRRFMLYRKGHPPLMKELTINQEIPIVIGMSGTESLTAAMVGKVEQSWEKNRFLYERLFAEIDGLALEGVKAIERGELEQLGELMNINQGLLNALGVSSWELEEMIQISRQSWRFRCKTYRWWWRWLDSRGMPRRTRAYCDGASEGRLSSNRDDNWRS